MRTRRLFLTGLLALLVVATVGCYPYPALSTYSSYGYSPPSGYYGKGYSGHYGHADYYRPYSAYGYHYRPYGHDGKGYRSWDRGQRYKGIPGTWRWPHRGHRGR